MKKILAGKKILITAGPTWVAIDRVRVITNIFSGRTGSIIAREAKKKGAEVKLLLGPGRLSFSPGFFKGIKVIKYHYFDELLYLVKKEVSSRRYDILIHSAAISDYLPLKQYNRKIPSGKDSLTIKLKPAIKIIKGVKKWDPHIFLVQFKLEVAKKAKELISIGYRSMLKNKADLAVVNDLEKMAKDKHEAYIIDLEKNISKVDSRSFLADRLLRIVADKLNNVRA
ncbi:MAG: phosphopantothenoylcysteine decarboxylase [Candidatus Omnitrophica bacterium]|nr:phosphopantothenoylcysteine decarboxylase [Candidatus Omnitrophota bacterium]